MGKSVLPLLVFAALALAGLAIASYCRPCAAPALALAGGIYTLALAARIETR